MKERTSGTRLDYGCVQQSTGGCKMALRDKGSEDGSIVFKPTGLDGVVLLDVADSSKRFAMEHRSLAITSISGGEGRIRYRRWTEAVRPGQVLIFEPGELHATTAIKQRASFQALFICPEIVESAFRASARGPGKAHFDVPSLDAAGVFDVVCHLQRILTDDGLEQGEKRERLIDGLTTLLPRASRAFGGVVASEERSAVSIDTAVVLEMAARIRESFARSIRDDRHCGRVVDVAGLAKGAGVSDVALIRAFQRVLGTSPYRYFTALRIRRARELMDRGPDRNEMIESLTDVAQAAGFYDSSDYTHKFKKHMGVTPSQYASAVNRRWQPLLARIPVPPGNRRQAKQGLPARRALV